MFFMIKNQLHITPIILAGGSGSRLWPWSRTKLPKQFLKLNNKYSMLQETLLRINELNILKPVIMSNEENKFIVKDQISEIDIKCEIVVEPISKNTAPAITLAALLLKKNNLLLILPADHIIQDNEIFKERINKAISHVKNNKIVTFGVKPTNPNTNYGYIEVEKVNNEIFKIKKFKEKPDISLAEKYLRNKNYFWNSGIFFFKSEIFLKEIEMSDSRIKKICYETVKTVKQDKNFKFFDGKIFIECPDISIDHSIMESTTNGIMLPLNSKWSDVGSWNAIHHISKKDQNSNVVKGQVIDSKTKNSLIYNLSDNLVVTNNIEDLIIVKTKDALLVTSTKHEQNIKPVVEKIREKFPEKVNDVLSENRPWGSFESLKKEEGYQVKKLIVKKGGVLSLQKHKYRSEHWVVIAGLAEVTKGKITLRLKMNESTYIKKGEIHSIKNVGNGDLIIVEVQIGNYLGEDDIERISDIYGRE